MLQKGLKQQQITQGRCFAVLQEGEAGIHQTELGIWDPFSVEDLLQKGVLDHLEAVSTISTNASKEFSLEKALDKMHADWEGLEFRIVEYKDTGTFIMGGTDEVQVREGLDGGVVLLR